MYLQFGVVVRFWLGFLGCFLNGVSRYNSKTHLVGAKILIKKPN